MIPFPKNENKLRQKEKKITKRNTTNLQLRSVPKINGNYVITKGVPKRILNSL